MTNLTSEQYRDVLHHVEGFTLETPNVQNLLRRAVETFYLRFGCYPEVAAAAPGKVSIFGEQTQFDDGLIFPIPTPMATVVVGRKVPGNRVSVVTSADVGKPHKVSFYLSQCPLLPGCSPWANYIKGVMARYCYHENVTAFEAAIESNLPLGVGFGSAAALEVATITFLEIMFGVKIDPVDKAYSCRFTEEIFMGKRGGISDKLGAILARDRNAMIIDTMTNNVQWIPFRNKNVVFVAIDPHLKDSFLEEEYSERSKYLRRACDLLGVENLRSATEESLSVLEERCREAVELRTIGDETVEDDWDESKYKMVAKYFRFYVSEMRRIKEAIKAWREKDVKAFGEAMTESHNALKEDYEFSNPLLEFLVKTSLEVEGVLGSKMIGMGLNNGGCVLTLLYKEDLQSYCEYVLTKYKENFQLLRAKLEPFASAEAGNAEGGKEISAEALGDDKNKEPEEPTNDFENQRQSANEVDGDDTGGKKRKKRTEPEEYDLSCYVINPIAGARMMFVLQTDLLRSRYARPVLQVKALCQTALKEYARRSGYKAEAAGVAPATITLFGEFLEHNMGYIIDMALPLVTVTVGGRNDSAAFSMATLSTEVEQPTEFRYIIPHPDWRGIQPQSWIDYALGTVSGFKGNVPGFNAVVASSVPCKIGLHSCSAFQASIYQFLEGLTGSCAADPFEKADACRRVEDRFASETPSNKCSSVAYVPTFLCKEGYVLFTNTKNSKMANYYLNHPAYVFMLACSRERSSSITAEDLNERLILCRQAAEVLGKNSLVDADERHVRCLVKRDAPEETIRRATYIVTEQQRCVRAIDAIKRDDYETLGLLMTESHCSLRDDFEVSNPEAEVIVNLALRTEGVLGAKLIGRGLSSTVLILARLSSVDKCIKYVRKNYVPRRDKPFFYVFRPSSAAFTMYPEDFFSIP